MRSLACCPPRRRCSTDTKVPSLYGAESESAACGGCTDATAAADVLRRRSDWTGVAGRRDSNTAFKTSVSSCYPRTVGHRGDVCCRRRLRFAVRLFPSSNMICLLDSRGSSSLLRTQWDPCSSPTLNSLRCSSNSFLLCHYYLHDPVLYASFETMQTQPSAINLNTGQSKCMPTASAAAHTTPVVTQKSLKTPHQTRRQSTQFVSQSAVTPNECCWDQNINPVRVLGTRLVLAFDKRRNAAGSRVASNCKLGRLD